MTIPRAGHSQQPARWRPTPKPGRLVWAGTACGGAAGSAPFADPLSGGFPLVAAALLPFLGIVPGVRRPRISLGDAERDRPRQRPAPRLRRSAEHRGVSSSDGAWNAGDYLLQPENGFAPSGRRAVAVGGGPSRAEGPLSHWLRSSRLPVRARSTRRRTGRGRGLSCRRASSRRRSSRAGDRCR